MVQLLASLPTGFVWRRAFALLSLVGYLLLWSHQALVQHVHCSTHDHFAHASQEQVADTAKAPVPAKASKNAARAREANSEDHDGCGHWAVLPQVATFIGVALTDVTLLPGSLIVDLGKEGRVHATPGLLLYAPKTSPPVLPHS